MDLFYGGRMNHKGAEQDGSLNEMKYDSNDGKHRNRKPKPDRTIWLVAEEKEESFFWSAVGKSYLCNKNCYWWVDVTPGTNEKNIMGRTDINYAYIAKFTSNHNNEWHGYPVTAERAPHDVPHSDILDAWRKLNFFSKKEATDIKKGRGYVKSCT
ncbi:TPA: hypothetical protein P7484_001649 [Klebsiella pneumoniae]|nr:hypothetical protein [Klebsiella pneumoniae]HDQ3505268.1 hypothetical protein [Klebsiella pneumoniae]